MYINVSFYLKKLFKKLITYDEIKIKKIIKNKV